MKRGPLLGTLAALLVAAIAAVGWFVALPRLGQAVLDRNVATFRAALGPGDSFTYDHATAEPLTRTARFDNVRLHLASGLTATAQHLALGNPGPHRLHHLHADTIQLTDPTATPATSVAIASLDATGLDDNVTPTVHPQAAPPQPAGTPPSPAAPDTTTHGKLIAAAQTLQHLSADDLSVRGLAITAGASGTIAALHLTGYGPGRSSDLDLRGLSIPDNAYTMTTHLQATGFTGQTTRHVSISLGDAHLHHVRLADLMAYVAAGRDDGPRALSQPSSLTADALQIAIRSDEGPEGTLGIGTFSVTEHATAPSIRSDLALGGLRFPARNLAQLMPDAFPDGEVHGDLGAHVEGNFETGATRLAPMRIDLQHLGSLLLTFDGTLHPQPSTGFAPSSLSGSGVMYTALSVGLADGGLRQALLARGAAMSNVGVDAFATGVSNRIQLTLAAFGPAASSLAPAIVDFVEHGGALEITAHPAHPLLLSNLLNPASQLGALATLNPTAVHMATLP